MPSKPKPPAPSKLTRKQLQAFNDAIDAERTRAGRRTAEPAVVLADARKAARDAVGARQAEAPPALRKTIGYAKRGNRTV
jgi:hypothetical protein